MPRPRSPLTAASRAWRLQNSGPTALGFTTFLTASTTGGSNVTFTWDLGDGAAASGPSVAHVYADIGSYTAVVTASNSASLLTATTTVQVQDVASIVLHKQMAPDPVLAGSAITVTLTISNAGPLTATEVTLTDPLPPGVTFGGMVEGDGAYDAGMNAVRWNGSLPSPLLVPSSLSTAALRMERHPFRGPGNRLGRGR